ncbi:hypothetical protein RRG08_059520 [Elysia crispata]|uniref:Uncharacterized protein n=1 Tax=Elysia crispata TaxID=231223 RepID=A0AAE1D2B2_9GAST|nr:hypothetical protein RRG08_059520 [Elysia crispata]
MSSACHVTQIWSSRLTVVCGIVTSVPPTIILSASLLPTVYSSIQGCTQRQTDSHTHSDVSSTHHHSFRVSPSHSLLLYTGLNLALAIRVLKPQKPMIVECVVALWLTSCQRRSSVVNFLSASTETESAPHRAAPSSTISEHIGSIKIIKSSSHDSVRTSNSGTLVCGAHLKLGNSCLWCAPQTTELLSVVRTSNSGTLVCGAHLKLRNSCLWCAPQTRELLSVVRTSNSGTLVCGAHLKLGNSCLWCAPQTRELLSVVRTSNSGTLVCGAHLKPRNSCLWCAPQTTELLSVVRTSNSGTLVCGAHLKLGNSCLWCAPQTTELLSVVRTSNSGTLVCGAHLKPRNSCL